MNAENYGIGNIELVNFSMVESLIQQYEQP